MTFDRPGFVCAMLFVSALGLSVLGCFGSGSGVQTLEDPIDGTTHYFVMYLDVGGYTAVSSREVAGKYHLEVMYVANGDRDVSVPPGTPVTFKIGDTLETLETSREALPVTNANESSVFTQWQLKFEPTPDEYDRLSRGPMTAIRVEIGGDTFTLQPDDGQSTTIQRNLTTLLGR